MSKVKLEEDTDVLTVNRKYAASYTKKKQHEERSILRDKYGELSSENSSSSEEEDENAEEWNSDVERDFLRTLSLLKSKNPSIYDSHTEFFTKALPQESASTDKSKKTSKSLYLKDYEREQLLEKGSMAGVSDSDSEEADTPRGKGGGLSYSQEQEELKSSFKAAAAVWEEGGAVQETLLIPRVKTKEEKAREEHDYVQWLKGGGVELAKEMSADLAPLKEYWGSSSLGEDERFLRDYILDRKYLEPDMSRVPGYDEVVASDSDPAPSDSEDEEALEEQETFERKYNFRFEEPDAELITSYPRTLRGTVRKEDDHRKVKRRDRLERKAREKEGRKEEIRRYRNLQEMEVKDKLDKLARVTGNPVESFGLSVEDIQADFDPETYDETMKKVFSEDYYEEEEEGEEEAKPVFSDLEGEDEGDLPWTVDGNWEQFNMDADYVGEGSGEGAAEGRERRRRRKQRSLDPTAIALEKEELSNRLKGELFSYREVEANDYGLSTEEILCSDNKDLNRWVSLTKAVQYLTPEEEHRIKKHYSKKAQNVKRKKATLGSDVGEGSSTDNPRTKPSTKKKKKKDGGRGSSKLKHSAKAKKLSQARLKSYGL